MGNVVPGHRGVLRRHSLTPLFPGQKLQLGRMPKPCACALCVSPEGQGSGRYDVKALSNGNTSPLQGSLKALRHIFGMNVMQRLHPYIWELERASLQELRE